MAWEEASVVMVPLAAVEMVASEAVEAHMETGAYLDSAVKAPAIMERAEEAARAALAMVAWAAVGTVAMQEVLAAGETAEVREGGVSALRGGPGPAHRIHGRHWARG